MEPDRGVLDYVPSGPSGGFHVCERRGDTGLARVGCLVACLEGPDSDSLNENMIKALRAKNQF